MPRIFIALNLPANIKPEFKAIQDNLRQQNSATRITWVSPEIAHINLHFLGDLDENKANDLKQNLNALEGKYGPILANLTGIGAFPSRQNPRILFLGIKHSGPDNLVKLYQETSKILRQLNLQADNRPFIAHVTLGRIKDRANNIKFLGEEMTDVEFKIDSFELMSSGLKPDGPEYRIIKSYKL